MSKQINLSNQNLISIIVPVYNAEKTLQKCIDSILNQTVIYFELILINDGSEDSSANICNKNALNDSRITVIHQVNSGASASRNVGLGIAKGAYVCFIDSDDWIEIDYLRTFLIGMYEKDKNCLIFQDCILDSHHSSKILGNFSEKLVLKDDFSLLFTEFNILAHGYSVSKFYSMNIIKENNLLFNVSVPCQEDLLFMLEYLMHIDSVYFINKSLYHYVNINPNSLSKKLYPYEHFRLVMKLQNQIFIKNIEKWKLNNKSLEIIKRHQKTALIYTLNSIFLSVSNVRGYKGRLNIILDIIANEDISVLLINDNVKRKFIDNISIKLFQWELLKFYDLFQLLRYRLNGK